MELVYVITCKDRYNNLILESAYPSEEMARTVVQYLKENYNSLYKDIIYEEVSFYNELILPKNN